MNLLKSKLTKHVWIDGYAWKVETVISPTDYDDYLLLSRKSEDSVHEDGTIPVEMFLLDMHNQEFYPDTKKVRALMAEIRAAHKKEKERRRPLTAEWLAMFGDDE